MKTGAFLFTISVHVYHDRVGGEGGCLENTIRMNLPKGLPLGFAEICVDFWDFRRGDPEVAFLLLLLLLLARADSTCNLVVPGRDAQSK